MAMENTAVHIGAEQEVRFKFGKNWSSFLRLLDESRIQEAEMSLKTCAGRNGCNEYIFQREKD